MRSLDEKVINWMSEDAMPMAARASAIAWLVRGDWLTWLGEDSLIG